MNESPRHSQLRALSKFKLLRPFQSRSPLEKPRISSPNQTNHSSSPSLTLAPPRSPAKAFRVLGIDSAPAGALHSPASDPATSPARAKGRLLPAVTPRPPHTGPAGGSFAAQQAAPIRGGADSAETAVSPACTPRSHLSPPQSDHLHPASAHALTRINSYFEFVPVIHSPALEAGAALRPSVSLPRLSVDSSVNSSDVDEHLAEALFTSSISAARLSRLGFHRDSISTQASSVDDEGEGGGGRVWPPPGLVSRFSDATTTVANSTTISLADPTDFDHAPNNYTHSLREYHLEAVEHLKQLKHGRSLMGGKSCESDDKVADWWLRTESSLASSRIDTPEPSSAYESVDDRDLLDELADMHRTPRRSSSLPSLVRSESTTSVTSSHAHIQSPSITATPLDEARLRPLKGGPPRDDGWKRHGWIANSTEPAQDTFSQGLGLFIG